jgi:hypothetical protein
MSCHGEQRTFAVHVRTWRKKTYEQLKKQFDIPLVGHGEATPPRYEPSLRE